MNNLFSNFLNRNFIFCDVGARWGLEEPWGSNRENIDVISFEPDQEEYLKLKKNKLERDLVLPYLLFSEEKKINLNLTKSRGCSSIYKPNFSYLERYKDIERFTVENNEIIEATTLDNLYHKEIIENLDFIKLDTQGAELDILKEGKKLLNEKIVGIQVEVYFKPIYESQPLFSDVDTLIREYYGLELIDIRKVFWKYDEECDIGPKKGQLIFGDALYFRDPHELIKWGEQFEDEEVINKILMACFMGILYGYPDYSLRLLGRPELIQWMKQETIDRIRTKIYMIAKCKKFSFKGCGRFWKFFHLLSKMFDPEPLKWATGERHLGSKKEFGIYY